MPQQLAHLLPNYRNWYAAGLVVQGRVLTGTLLVEFDVERNVTYDKELILAQMRRVNRRMPDGYAIQIMFREQSYFESWYTSLPKVKVYVLASLASNECAGAAACYSPDWNTIRLTPGAPDSVVVHELFHKLGLGHSGSRLSVMYWNQGVRPVRDIRTFDAEVRALVEAYR